MLNLRLPAALLLSSLAGACCGALDCSPAASAPAVTTETAMSNLHSIPVRALDGAPADLAQYKGKVLLVVNTASECGLTPQYAGLERLYQQRKAQGLVVLGFPSNDFGNQEPGDAAQIRGFCTQEYGITFPLFEKVVTKDGAGQSPVYGYLGSATGQLPTWNFAKYLVGKDGRAIGFYSSKTAPDDPALLAALDAALAAQ